jgi:hypothetical protein
VSAEVRLVAPRRQCCIDPLVTHDIFTRKFSSTLLPLRLDPAQLRLDALVAVVDEYAHIAGKELIPSP